MDFAADAVFEPVAAPPRGGASARPMATDASEPSFADHLEAVAAEDAPLPRESAPEPPRAEPTPQEQPTSGFSSTQPEADQVEQATTGAEPTADPVVAEAPAAALVVQVVANTAPAPTPTTSTAPNGSAKSAGASAAPIAAPSSATAAPAASSEAGADQAGASTGSPASAEAPAPGDSASEHAKSASAHVGAKSTDPAPQANAAASQPAQQTSASQSVPAATSPAPAATDVAPQDVDEATLAAASILSAAQSAQPSAPREGLQRTGKNDHETGKNAAVTQAAGTPSPVASQHAAGAKSAPHPAGKDGVQPAPASSASAPAPASDAPQPAQQTSPAAAAASTHAASHTQHAPDQAARAAPAAAQIAREIVRQFNGESTSFELRLDPPELGRVDVRLEVSRDHRVTALIAADSPQALAELARNARELEQMLQSAGLELSDSGLSFDLRQGNEGADEAAGEAGPRGGARAAEASEAPQQQIARPLGYERWRGVRIDMMV